MPRYMKINTVSGQGYWRLRVSLPRSPRTVERKSQSRLPRARCKIILRGPHICEIPRAPKVLFGFRDISSIHAFHQTRLTFETASSCLRESRQQVNLFKMTEMHSFLSSFST